MDKILRNIMRYCFYASFVPVFLLLVITTLDVGARYIFNSSIDSALEICSMLLSMGISLGLGYVAFERENFSVTFLLDRLPATARNILNAMTSFFAASICFILVTHATKKALYSYEIGEYTGALFKVYFFPAKFLFAFGFLLACLAFTVHFIKGLRRGNSDHIEERKDII